MTAIIGMDPHKRTATIEVIDERGRILATGSYGTDKAGYAEMLQAGRMFADRVWAIEGCNGIGHDSTFNCVHRPRRFPQAPPPCFAVISALAWSTS